jgi:hypothetical protein
MIENPYHDRRKDRYYELDIAAPSWQYFEPFYTHHYI